MLAPPAATARRLTGAVRAVQLFLGDTNRTISETPMNMASSRSHCMFMVHIEARKVRLCRRLSRVSSVAPQEPVQKGHVYSEIK